MPAEENIPCVILPKCSTEEIKSKNFQSCDFRIFVNPALKHKCISEDDNFFDELRDTRLRLENDENNESVGKCNSWKYKSIHQSKMKSSIMTNDISKQVMKSRDAVHFEQKFKNEIELHQYSVQALKKTIDDLATAIENVSSQLVSLLQENDTLQQESDARNIAIEQLLKLTVKQTEVELRPVQMSVILPAVSDSANEWE